MSGGVVGNNSKFQLVHLITDLNGFGGTEATLFRYIRESKLPPEQHLVIVLKNIGVNDTIGAQIASLGVGIFECNQKGFSNSPSVLRQLIKRLRGVNIVALVCWLYHPALIGLFLKVFLRQQFRIIWHIRCLPYAKFRETPVRYFIIRLLAKLSSIPSAIVANSKRAKLEHEKMGYLNKSWSVVPNGLDVSLYGKSQVQRQKVRQDLGIGDRPMLISVGRNVTEKGYPFLMDAFRELIPQNKNIVLVVCGANVEENKMALNKFTQEQVKHNLRLLGRRPDVPALLGAADVMVSASISESFPNVVIEGMAAGLPCVVTDVGDVEDILDQPEWVVRPGDAGALASKINLMVNLPKKDRETIGDLNRKRVVDCYTVDAMVTALDSLHLNSLSAS